MNRAFVALDIKAMDDDQRIIEGWASRPDADRVGDVVLPAGAKYKLPLPFLLDHDHKQAVGEVEYAQVTDDGIKFRARIKKIAEPGEVKDLCDKAWALVKNGLRRAVSIGFAVKEYDLLPTGGLMFKSWEWLELSAVTVPCAPGAEITSFKDFKSDGKIVTISEADEDRSQPTAAVEKADDIAASGKKVHVARLKPARDRAEPFVIRTIKRTA